MEGISISGGVTVVGSDVQPDPPRQQQSGMPPAETGAGLRFPYEMVGDLSVKKKRGRPRKYAPDGTLSPTPISSAAPPQPVIDFSVGKRGKVRPVGLVGGKRPLHRMEVHSLGEWRTGSLGGNFTPHILTVNPGEDVMMKVISFSQQGPRAICILSANGVISSVTLRQPDSSGGTLTYEGRFEILSLTGSFMLSETCGIRNRSGGMSVSLASSDGRVMGGGVAGSLLAAAPVQIVVGSFLAGSQNEQSNKKPKIHTVMAPTPTNITHTRTENEDTYSEDAPHTAPKSNLPFLTSFRGEGWSAFPSTDSRNKPTDINVTLSG